MKRDKDELLDLIRHEWPRIANEGGDTITLYWQTENMHWNLKTIELRKVKDFQDIFQGWELTQKDYAEAARIRDKYRTHGTVTRPWSSAATPEEQAEMVRATIGLDGGIWWYVDYLAPGQLEKRIRERRKAESARDT